jgi:hypothetical protein
LPIRGRERLTSECPQGHPLGEGVGTVRTFHVPVAGGPSTGKSTYLAGALIELDEAAASGTFATAVQSSSRQAYDRILDGFRKGITPPKTSGVPPAVVAEIRGRSKSALLYAYDVAGEVYGDEDELRRDPAHGLAEGVILLVDPFALERVKSDWQDEIDGEPELRPSIEAPQRMLERLVGVLEEQGVDLSKISAAICVTKIDALGIGDAIEACGGDDDHERTRAWLEQSGAGNFVRAAEEAFRDVHCFGVSALGRMPSTGDGAFTPRGAAAPLLWLLRRAGIEPAPVGEAQPTRTHKLVSAAPVDVKPKRPLFAGPLDAIKPMSEIGNFFVGLAAAAGLALAMVPLANAGAGGSSPDQGAAVSGFVNTSNEPAPVDPGTDPSTSTPTPDDTLVEETPTPEETTTPEESPTPEATPRPPKANSPAGALRRHFESITAGDYGAAFEMMSTRYRAANPNWTQQPSEAEPYINLAETGPTRFVGPGSARVYVKFYGHDRYAAGKSDTACRRFEGEARMSKENGRWRYDGGDNYAVTVLSASLKACNP